MRRRFILSIMFACVAAFSYSTARAEDPFSVVANNLYYGGHDCSAIEDSHIRKLGGGATCTAAFAVSSETSSLDPLKAVVYDKAKGLARGTTTCLANYGERLFESKEAMQEYRRKLTVAWLNRKKAQLLIRECRTIDALMPYHDHANPTVQGKESRELTDKERAYFVKYHPDVKIQYYPMCRTPQNMSALKGVIAISEKAVPFLSSPEILDVLEKNRSMIISDKTGKPVTDEEIRDVNLAGEESFVGPDEKKLPAFFEDLKSHVAQQRRKREAFTKNLSDNFSEGSLRDLFDDGSARDAMNEIGLGEAAATKDPEARRMHYCLRSIYEKNAVADVVEMVALFVFFKRVAPTGVTATLGRAGAWAPEAFLGTAAAGPILYRSCRHLQGADHKVGGRGEAEKVTLGAVPKGFDIDLFKLSSLSMDQVKSCQDGGVNRLYEKKRLEASCAFELVAAALPVGFFGSKVSALVHAR